MQIIDRNANTFDAVVVGSGATGGWAAKQLTEAGLKVCVLEAGPKITPADFTEHDQPYQYPYRNIKHENRNPAISERQPMQGLCYAVREYNHKWFVDDIDNPITTPENKPFHWIRMRILGGRSLSWGRQSYRLSDLDFKAASHDGFGMDWPISYKDVEPYYSQVEKYVGISGETLGLPQLPDSDFLPPMAMTCGEKLIRQRVQDKLGRTVTIGRAAVLTKPLNGRAACHYCGPCEQGCVTFSYFSSPFTTLKSAEATGKLTLRTDAVVSHVTTDKSTGKASGVAYIDRNSRTAHEVKAKVVFLCASTLESTRLLLNSAPGGLANSSGVLGHYLMDHIYRGYSAGFMPEVAGKAWSGAPRRPNGLYVPRFRNVDRSETNGFIRGYGYQGGCFPEFSTGAPGFGKAYKQRVRSENNWRASLIAFCECLPRYENHVTLNHDVRDAWGIPVLHVDMDWSENEKALWRDAQVQGSEMLEAAGARDIVNLGRYSVPGFGIHEMGTARMGADPKQSVLNGFNQTHDVKNLFVTDGAAFTSVGCQNPTLTMMALTVRACDYYLDQRKKGALA